MSLSNKKFRNNKTGDVVKVIDSFENIAILENKEKIDVSKLLNPGLYTEEIDPNQFFNNQNSYNLLAEKIKTINTALIKDEGETPVTSINIGDNSFSPISNESAIIVSSEEDERAELERKYGVSSQKNEVERQNQAFAKLLGEDSEEVQTIQVNRTENNSVQIKQQPIMEDPIITMFKNVKRNKDFSISLEIKNKIPRPDFIEMMEDSYNTSIIDFLATEFTQNILRNPQMIEDMIKQKIKEIVYGVDKSELPVNPQITDSVTQLNNEKHEPLSFEKEPVLSKDLPKKTTTRKPKAKKETSK